MSDLVARKNEVLKMVGQTFTAKKTKFPTGYDHELALELAIPILMDMTVGKDKKPALLNCDPKSIAGALYLMCVKGYRVDLHHCGFVPRAGKMTLTDQYQGKIMMARRDAGLVDMIAEVVYKGDDLQIKRDDNGKKSYVHNSGSFAERKTDLGSIIGVWCYLFWSDGKRTAHEMTIDQVRKAWEMGYVGNAHNNFSEKMAKKTCINSAMTEWGATCPKVPDTFYDVDAENVRDVEHEDLSNQMQITAETLGSLPASEVEPINLPNEAPKAKPEPTKTTEPQQESADIEDMKPLF